MTEIKMCGLSRLCDIRWANEIRPEFVGFVFFKKSSRYVSPQKAAELKAALYAGIKAVGVFVNEDPMEVARLLNEGTIDLAQLHGSEDEDYIKSLRALTEGKLIQAFVVKSEADLERVKKSSADLVLLDAGAGDGKTFDWSILAKMDRPYFLAGGLDPGNVKKAVGLCHPYGVDVSSGIETDGFKDKDKMTEFAKETRNG